MKLKEDFRWLSKPALNYRINNRLYSKQENSIFDSENS